MVELLLHVLLPLPEGGGGPVGLDPRPSFEEGAYAVGDVVRATRGVVRRDEVGVQRDERVERLAVRALEDALQLLDAVRDPVDAGLGVETPGVEPFEPEPQDAVGTGAARTQVVVDLVPVLREAVGLLVLVVREVARAPVLVAPIPSRRESSPAWRLRAVGGVGN